MYNNPKRQAPVNVLLFDLGGVVFDIDFNRIFRAWAQYTDLSAEQIRERFSMDAEYEQYERGEIDGAIYFQHVRDLLALKATDQEIIDGWNAIFVGDIAQTAQDIVKARAKFPCYALTNTNPAHQVEWQALFPQIVQSFEHVFVSSEIGMRKPDKIVFDTIAREIGVDLSSILFFDDSLENIEGARHAGVQTVHVRTPADVTEALVELGAI